VADRQLRARFWIEIALAVVGVVLGVLTMFVQDWFERVFEASPDQGSGEFEWLISLGFLLAAAAMGYLAQREWRRTPLRA
jgi:hypothetical protein